MTTHAAITIQNPSAPVVARKPRVIDDRPRDDSKVVPNGGPTILASENRPCSRPSIVPRSSWGTAPVVSVVRAVACTWDERDTATDASVVNASPTFDAPFAASSSTSSVDGSASSAASMTREPTIPKRTIDASLHPMPAYANRSDLFPTQAMAGTIPTAEKAAMVRELALMNIPNWPVVKFNLLARIRGRIVVNADEETPFKSLTNRRGPMVGCRR